MAGTAKTIGITRPNQDVLDPTGTVYTSSPADHLLVTVDLYSNGLVTVYVKLNFTDYAGLQAEWESGSATTVLQAALDDYFANTFVAPEEELTPAQRSFVTGYSYVIS